MRRAFFFASLTTDILREGNMMEECAQKYLIRLSIPLGAKRPFIASIQTPSSR